MSLKITVKPNESTRIGRSEITVVSDQNSTIIIGGEVPVLRAEHVIEAHFVRTVMQKLHYVLQERYLSEDADWHPSEYFSLTARLIDDCPEASIWVCETNQLLISGRLYEAVKLVSERVRLEEQGQIPMSSAIGI